MIFHSYQQIHSGAREAFQVLLTEEQKPAVPMGGSNYGNGKYIDTPPPLVPSRVNIDDIVSGSKRLDSDMILKKLNDTLVLGNYCFSQYLCLLLSLEQDSASSIKPEDPCRLVHVKYFYPSPNNRH
jgi:hypothetical protein